MKNTLNIAFKALLILSLGLNLFLLSKKNHERIEKSVVYVEKTDTFRDTVTVPQLITKTVTKIKHDTVTVIEEILASNDTTPQKEFVSVPFEQKEYGRDSVYKAWVSGFDVNLDSIRIYFRKTIVTETIVKHKIDNKRFGIGPYVGAGYDFRNKNWGWGVGVAFTYDFIKF